MKDYKYLENIRDMDFKQMRALIAEGTAYATDEAIYSMIDNLSKFFAQFKNARPNKEELDNYNQLMKQIIAQASKAEYEYFLKKYADESPENAKIMASTNTITDENGLIKRMQYWATSGKFGDDVRNPQLHKSVTAQMQRWIHYSKNSNISHSFFERKENFDIEQDYINSNSKKI